MTEAGDALNYSVLFLFTFFGNLLANNIAFDQCQIT